MNMTGNPPNVMRGRGRRGNRHLKVIPIQRTVMGPPTRPVLKRKAGSSSAQTSSLINWKGQSTNLSDTVRTTTTTRSYSTTEPESIVILALTEGRGEAACEVGIAAINITKPSLILCQISDSQSYINTLTKINILNPSEILVPLTLVESISCNRLMEKIKEQFRTIKITGVSRASFNNRTGMEYVKQLCVPSMNSIFLILQHRYYALAAAAALLTYTEATFFIFYAKESIKVVYQESEDSTIIDVATADRLELVASARPTMKKRYSCLLEVLNYCHTKIGIRTLRANILQPPCSAAEIEARLDCVTELMENTEMLTAIQEILIKVNNIDQLLSLATILPDHAQSCSERQLNYLLTLNTVLQQIQPLKNVFKNSNQSFFIEIFNILSDAEFLQIKSLVQNIIHNDAQSAKGQSGIIQRCFAIKSGLNSVLDLVRKSYSERLDEMREYVKTLSEKYGLSFVLHNNNKKGYHILLNLNGHQKRTFKRADIPAEFIQVEHLTNSYTMKTQELINLSHRAEDIMSEILIMSNIMIHKLLIKIRKHVAIFYNLCEAVAKLDMLQSLAHASSNINYVRPNFADYLEVIQARHPLLNFLCSTEPVANSIFASKEYNMNIITGPNGSGKSIFIRQVVLIQVMAQVGCYVPAESATFKLCDRILARVYLEDNIHCGASAFVLEMKEINFFLTVLTNRTLIIIDELCRSTSIEEGTALAMAICEKLLKTDAFMFFTTHYKFLTQLKDLYFNVKNWQLETLTETKDNEIVLHFSYNVIPGVVSLEHYGLFLAKATWPASIMKYVNDVIENLPKSQTNPSLRFKRVSAVARLKYDLEAEAQYLKAKGQLTRPAINEKLLNYQRGLAELGHDVNVPYVDLDYRCSVLRNEEDFPMNDPENDLLLQDSSNFEVNLTNDSSVCSVNDQYGLVQINVSAQVHRADDPTAYLDSVDRVRSKLFPSVSKPQLFDTMVEDENTQATLFGISQANIFEPQVIITSLVNNSNDTLLPLETTDVESITFEALQRSTIEADVPAMCKSQANNSEPLFEMTDEDVNVSLIKPQAENTLHKTQLSFSSETNEGAELLTFQELQESVLRQPQGVPNEQRNNFEISSSYSSLSFKVNQVTRPSIFENRIPLQEYFRNEIENVSDVGDISFGNSQAVEHRLSLENLILSQNESFIHHSIESAKNAPYVSEPDVNCDASSINESQFRLVLQQNIGRTSTPVPQQIKSTKKRGEKLNDSFNKIYTTPVNLGRLNSTFTSDSIQWNPGPNSKSSRQNEAPLTKPYYSSGKNQNNVKSHYSKISEGPLRLNSSSTSTGIRWNAESNSKSDSPRQNEAPLTDPLKLNSTSTSSSIRWNVESNSKSDSICQNMKSLSVAQKVTSPLQQTQSSNVRTSFSSKCSNSNNFQMADKTKKTYTFRSPARKNLEASLNKHIENVSESRFEIKDKNLSSNSRDMRTSKMLDSSENQINSSSSSLGNKLPDGKNQLSSSLSTGATKKIDASTSSERVQQHSSSSADSISFSNNVKILASVSLPVGTYDDIQPYLKNPQFLRSLNSSDANKSNSKADKKVEKKANNEIESLDDLANCTQYISTTENDVDDEILTELEGCKEFFSVEMDEDNGSRQFLRSLSSSDANKSNSKADKKVEKKANNEIESLDDLANCNQYFSTTENDVDDEILTELESCKEFFSVEMDEDNGSRQSEKNSSGNWNPNYRYTSQCKDARESFISNQLKEDLGIKSFKTKTTQNNTLEVSNCSLEENSPTDIFGENSYESREIERSFVDIAEQVSQLERIIKKKNSEKSLNSALNIQEIHSQEERRSLIEHSSLANNRSGNQISLEEFSSPILPTRKNTCRQKCPPIKPHDKITKTTTNLSALGEIRTIDSQDEINAALNSNLESLGDIQPINRSKSQDKTNPDDFNKSLEPLGDVHLELFSQNSIEEEILQNTTNSNQTKLATKRKSIGSEASSTSDSNSVKKLKWLPPYKTSTGLSKKEIQRIYYEQNKQALETGNVNQIINRPSVRQLQQVEHIVSAHKTSSGIIVVPGKKKAMKSKKKFVAPLKQSSGDFDITIFSDKNCTKYEELMNINTNSTVQSAGFVITSSPVITKDKSAGSMLQKFSKPGGYYSQSSQELHLIRKYLDLSSKNIEASRDASPPGENQFNDSITSNSSSLFHFD